MKIFGRKKGKEKTPRPAVGLVLGGGGARGFIEIGALKAFKEKNIKFDICVGTSVGSLVGALYSAGIDPDDMIKAGEALDISDLHGKILLKPDDPKKVGRVVYNLIGDAKIENLHIKYAAVATDLITGKQVVLDSGSVIDAVSASAAYPVFYTPLKKDGMNLCDGGLVNNVPTDVCKMLGAERTCVVDLSNRRRGSGADGVGIVDMVKGLISIMSANASVMGRTAADVLISPDTTAYSSTSKNGYREMIELGYTSAMEKIEEVEKLFVIS